MKWFKKKKPITLEDPEKSEEYSTPEEYWKRGKPYPILKPVKDAFKQVQDILNEHEERIKKLEEKK